MVEFADGSVKAHLGATDMRVPIQYAFSHPRRWEAPLPPVDFAALGRLDFAEPDLETFGCLRLAFEAGTAGGTAPAVLNAANEVAVAAFLADRMRLPRHRAHGRRPRSRRCRREPLESLEQLEAVDAEARRAAARRRASRSTHVAHAADGYTGVACRLHL